MWVLNFSLLGEDLCVCNTPPTCGSLCQGGRSQPEQVPASPFLMWLFPCSFSCGMAVLIVIMSLSESCSVHVGEMSVEAENHWPPEKWGTREKCLLLDPGKEKKIPLLYLRIYLQGYMKVENVPSCLKWKAWTFDTVHVFIFF